jgi:hypothetical protein
MGLVLVTVCAFSAVVATSAFATPSFLSHPPGPLSATANNTQIFKTPAGNVECTKVSLFNTSTKTLQDTSLLVTLHYTGCKAFGTVATVHLVKYTILANGLVHLDNTPVILAICGQVTVPQAQNQNLEKVTFSNNASGGVLLVSNVTGITSVGTGVEPCSYGENHTGTYTGNVTTTLTNGGTLRWDK